MKLNILVAGVSVYVMKTGVKIGSKGKVLPAGEAFSAMSKGEVRKVRKALFEMGRRKEAAAVTYRPEPQRIAA